MEDCMWLNRLNLRMTYGVGGNVPKDAGPYMTVVDSGYNEWVGDFGSYIQNPPNSQLRWEKTASTNVGIDFSAFNSRLSGSIDYRQHGEIRTWYRSSETKRLLMGRIL